MSSRVVAAASKRSAAPASSVARSSAPCGSAPGAAPETITWRNPGIVDSSGRNAGSSGAETTSAHARLSRSMKA